MKTSTEKKERIIFDWSRQPSKESVKYVFIADHSARNNFGRDMTKEQIVNSLYQYNSKMARHNRIQLIKSMRVYAAIVVPVLFFVFKIIFS